MAKRSYYLIGKRHPGAPYEAFHESERTQFAYVARGRHHSPHRARERAAKANLLASHSWGDAKGRARGRARRIIGKYMHTPAYELPTREREELRRAMKVYYGDAGMTKKHFIAIAETLAAIPDAARRHEEVNRWIPTLRAQNPRFDADRFRRYVDAQAGKQSRAAGAAYADSRASRARPWKRAVGGGGVRHRRHRAQCSQCGALGGGHFKSCGRRARSLGSRLRRFF